MARLDDQITWYDLKSTKNQRAFKRTRIAEISAAALIPAVALISPFFHYSELYFMLVISALAVLIVIFEIMLQINEYQENWKTYRSTCESLKREKYLYMAKAGPYAGIQDPRSMLAERVESLSYQEHAKWSSVQQPKET